MNPKSKPRNEVRATYIDELESVEVSVTVRWPEHTQSVVVHQAVTEAATQALSQYEGTLGTSRR